MAGLSRGFFEVIHKCKHALIILDGINMNRNINKQCGNVDKFRKCIALIIFYVYGMWITMLITCG